MSNRATAEIFAPRLGLVGSLALHVGIVAVTLFTWAHKLDITEQPSQIVPVDLVTVADQTNVAPMVKEPLPLLPQPDLIQPQPQPVPAEPKVEVTPTLLPKPAPPPPPQTKKEQVDNIINALLDKRSVPAVAKNAKPGAQNVKGIGAQTAMTADLTSMLQSEIYKCWSPPVGAPHPERLIVIFDLFINKDGTVSQQSQLAPDSAETAAKDPYMTAAKQSASRAIYMCQPYKLPADRYNQWSHVTFKFDPRVMLEQ
jgi:hypothetical protein